MSGGIYFRLCSNILLIYNSLSSLINIWIFIKIMVGGKWKEPKYVPECLLSHLETFVWERFDWGRKEEKEVATYTLKNARRLNKETFFTTPIESEELNKLKKRRKILDELDGVVRASNSCHLVFEFDSTCYVSETLLRAHRAF